jgi:hypothetical protein
VPSAPPSPSSVGPNARLERPDRLTLVDDDPSQPVMQRILGTIRDDLGGAVLNGPGGPAVPLSQSLQANSPDSTPQSGPK